MEYKGNLYGKIGRRYIPLKMTSEEVDALQRERDYMLNAIRKFCESYRGECPEHIARLVYIKAVHDLPPEESCPEK